jgi:hypothetical protein
MCVGQDVVTDDHCESESRKTIISEQVSI